MSLESTATIKSKLALGLGQKAPRYWKLLRDFLIAKISRAEFDDEIRQCVNTSTLAQLHNALIISLFDPSTHKVAAITPPPEVPKGPPRKRRRVLPYQGEGEDDADDLRSERLKQWVIGVGKRERERIRSLHNLALSSELELNTEPDLIARENPVYLPSERGEPAGSRPPVQLASSARGFTLNHVTDRINLICAQHNLGQSPRTVAQLLCLAFEAKLKQLVTEALSLTSASHAITSIKPSMPHTSRNTLTTSAFDTLFTVAPAVLPNSSAAAVRLTSGDLDRDGDDLVATDETREPDDPQWQLLALLKERSGVAQELFRK
ncbi:transcriptional regulator of RNA polII, SAGA, subunit-domain-containing protein [Vararia minispora EC-137]|uniref:Transcriptional regulator of RNA polII, SAGA, subunit-domain-containing protein n=1 Tax=Vararia minispora EC-137 TaxID=1314806 RepID=A0ACB8Q5F0_9AGAM|nr:transcriptional regulator of RNA polII, SAGA, subunit-domain-containing protein [Vararia minispora EC-137]